MHEREHEHYEHHEHEGSSVATMATVLIVLLVIGFLVWNFLPVRGDRDASVDINLPEGTEQNYIQ